MRSIKKLLLVAIIASSTVLSSSATTETNPENARLSYEIQDMLNKAKFEVKQESSAEVMFTFNKDREIVVLSIEHDDNVVKNIIKSKLNYKKLSAEYKGKDRIFKVPVKLVPDN